MAAKRYTEKALTTDVKEMNEALAHTGFFLRVNPRNGMCGVDLYRKDANRSGGVCVRNIELGTPRECYNAAVDFMDGSLADNPAPTQANHKSPFGPM